VTLYTINVKRVQYPLNPVDSLYWVSGAPDSAGPYAASCFFFSSADGMRLIPATSNVPALVDALNSIIADNPTAAFAPGLQTIVNQLTADNAPPPPRYPQIGDTGVKGVVLTVYDGPWFEELRSPTPPPGWGDPTKWKGPLWCGIVVADVEANNYSTPPAVLVESGPLTNVFRFQFKSPTEVVVGPCTFSIVQGENVAVAADVVPA